MIGLGAALITWECQVVSTLPAAFQTVMGFNVLAT